MSRKKLWATSTTGEFLTPYEFAQRTNCSEAHIYRQLLAGRLEAIRIGVLWRLPRNGANAPHPESSRQKST